MAVPKGTIIPSRAKVYSRAAFGIFGVKLLSGEVDMAYDRGHLVQFGMLVGANLDIKVARLTGNLAFRYCLGNIGASQTRDARLADCSPFQYQATARPGYRIDLGGLIKVIGIKKTYYWNIAEQAGREGDPAFEPKQPPGPLPGPTADITPEDLPDRYFLSDERNGIPLGLGNLEVRFRSIRPAEVKIPRESRTVQPCASIQVGTQAYRPEPGTYPNVDPLDPVTTGDCGLIASYTSSGDYKDVRTVPLVCSTTQCMADDKQFRMGGPNGSLKDARDQILTQLRQPPGVLPPGAEIYLDGPLIGMRSDLYISRGPDKYGLTWQGTDKAGRISLKRIVEFPETRRADTYYYLTERGILRSSIDGGGSVGSDAALSDGEMSKPERQPVLALEGGEIVVYCGPGPDYGVLWKYGRNGYVHVRACRWP